MPSTRKNHVQDLRIASVVRGRQIHLKVDGKSVTAFEGETVHAALTAAGIRRLNQSKSNQSESNRARGVFCGMGICYECLVTINHIPDQRACITLVQDQMEIHTHEG
jgi:predicted molibdopterin-dependent oxidoreductase YjgC